MGTSFVRGKVTAQGLYANPKSQGSAGPPLGSCKCTQTRCSTFSSYPYLRQLHGSGRSPVALPPSASIKLNRCHSEAWVPTLSSGLPSEFGCRSMSDRMCNDELVQRLPRIFKYQLARSASFLPSLMRCVAVCRTACPFSVRGRKRACRWLSQDRQLEIYQKSCSLDPKISTGYSLFHLPFIFPDNIAESRYHQLFCSSPGICEVAVSSPGTIMAASIATNLAIALVLAAVGYVGLIFPEVNYAH